MIIFGLLRIMYSLLLMIWQIFGIDYGKKEKNPIDNVYFYSKNNPTGAFQIRKEQVHIKCHFSKKIPLPFPQISVRTLLTRHSFNFWFINTKWEGCGSLVVKG